MEKIAIVGMGTMGSAIHGLLAEKYDVIGVGRDCEDLRVIGSADALIMAVKPQSFNAAADELWMHIRDEQLIISIMAGVTLRALSRRLGNENVVRTMPNLGLAQGQSMTAWLPANETMDTGLATSIVDMWGASLRLDDEAQFDAFTALAGSGPAYFFELGRSLEAVALAHGFDAARARQIAAQTFLGAASTVLSETDFAGQIQSVASGGGATEAALRVLATHNFEGMVSMAVDAACERSRELGA